MLMVTPCEPTAETSPPLCNKLIRQLSPFLASPLRVRSQKKTVSSIVLTKGVTVVPLKLRIFSLKHITLVGVAVLLNNVFSPLRPRNELKSPVLCELQIIKECDSGDKKSIKPSPSFSPSAKQTLLSAFRLKIRCTPRISRISLHNSDKKPISRPPYAYH